MSVAFVIMCNEPVGNGECGETAWASPTLDGYRRLLGLEGWTAQPGTRAPHGWDRCPTHSTGTPR